MSMASQLAPVTWRTPRRLPPPVFTPEARREHELNNVMFGLMSILELLDGAEGTERDELLADLQRTVQRAHALNASHVGLEALLARAAQHLTLATGSP